VASGQGVSETDAWLPNGSPVIVQPRVRLRSREARQLTCSRSRVDERLPGRVGQLRIGVADVAKFIVRSAKKLVAKAQVQGQALGRTIVVLHKPGIGGYAVVVISRASSRLSEKRAPARKFWKSLPNPAGPARKSGRCPLPAGCAQRDSICLSTKAEL